MATQADLRNATAEFLNIRAAGETVSSEDAEIIDNVTTRLQAELEEKGLAHWAISAIPDECVHGMSVMAAADLAPRYKRPEVAVLYVQGRSQGERLIREMVAAPDTGKTTAKEYF